uniref:Immunodominant membrane protein n=2 Tax=Candidatus Phytoplasma prunorum TaxID=47565 RepID=D5GSR2_9MOLU|nr:immunodominant membrane protein Imp [Candidatus Phytoplasma prunorum]CBI70427.1 immunodominant membrane protein [Candidatus Phytoplasma prunorum]
METNQQKMLTVVGSIFGVLVLYFVLAWSMSFWPFSVELNKQEIFSSELNLTLDSNSLGENVFTKVVAERKKNLQEQVTKKVESFITSANKLLTTEPDAQDKKTLFNQAKESLGKIKTANKTLTDYNEEFFAESSKTASTATLKTDIKKVADEIVTFKENIKNAFNLN